MKNKINILSEELRDQIAAGEVIENPASLIKELVENAIDAQAKNIIIKIKGSGIEKIEVIDDGIGINKDELPKAPLRHATSKIKDFNDLYSIKTLGFRGEALASIFSVSQATLYSKPKEQEKGYFITYKNNAIKEKEGPNGTIVTVSNLFYNTPARRKYLKTSIQEYKEILKLIESYAIINYDISFKLFNEGKIVFYKPTFKNLKENILYLFKDEKGYLLNVNYKNSIEIEGFISDNRLQLRNKNKQYIFVNKRFVKSKLIEKAIYDAYGTTLMGKHPLFILNINIDPEIIDVNIHPKKIEIKFENEIFVYNKINQVITNVLNRNKNIIDINIKEKEKELNLFENKINNNIENRDNLSVELKKNLNPEEKIDKKDNIETSLNKLKEYTVRIEGNINKEALKRTYQRDLNESILKEEDKENYTYSKNKINKKLETYGLVKDEEEIKKEDKPGALYDYFENYKLLGQINKTYILVETKDALVTIDQHVVEEKYHFEKIKKKFSLKQHSLLREKEYSLNEIELVNLKENEKFIRGIGFDFDIKYNKIIIKKVPIYFNKIIDFEGIIELLRDIKDINNFEEEIYDRIASISCKMSIKGGMELTNYEMKKLIEKLRHIQDPYNCPHGRPILLKITFKELEKHFKRTI